MTNIYIQTVVESCKKDRSYAVMLNVSKIKEIDELLQRNCTYVQSLFGGMVKVFKINDILIKFYKSGKMIIKNVQDIDALLNKILS